MAVQIALLRGINLGARNRIAMPALRERLGAAGFDDVQTYVQSGNVVLRSSLSAEKLARAVEREITDAFGLEVAVLTRTRTQLAKVLEHNPLAAVAQEPKRYLVSFLSAAPAPQVVTALEDLQAETEAFRLIGREIYSWHPDGVGRSKLWTKLAGKGLGVTATGRNWTTVGKLLELADELAGD
jgi:uncharacterized protein (DUF1697 family)